MATIKDYLYHKLGREAYLELARKLYKNKPRRKT